MAWTIGRAFGIPVRLHITMLLLPLLTSDWVSTDGVLGLAVWGGLVVMLFGSVLLHELGHALMARRYGIQTFDIVLTPIGGMARVAMTPSNPKHEIAVALAGPIVSLALAGAAFLATIPMALLPFAPEAVHVGLLVLCGANLMLGLFNLVPALPMDGGRVLRGILALRRGFLDATRIAVKVGRALAVAGIVYAIWSGRFTLALIAVFIYLAAGSELRMAELRAAVERAGGPAHGDHWQRWDAVFGRSRYYGSGPGSDWNARGNGAPGMDAAPTRSESTPLSEREVIVVGGKAEVIGRKDPK